MQNFSDKQIRRFGGLVYLIAVAIIAIPILDWMAAVWPIRVGEATWRFGAVGLVGQGLINGTIGVLLLYVACVLFDHRGVRIFLGVLACLMALLLVVLTVGFILDAIQLRGNVRVEMRRGFDFNTLRTLAILPYFSLLYIVLAVFIVKGSRERRKMHVSERALVADVGPIHKVTGQ
jgi:uncharacterized membrane protein YidH (DUF202 family)